MWVGDGDGALGDEQKSKGGTNRLADDEPLLLAGCLQCSCLLRPDNTDICGIEWPISHTLGLKRYPPFIQMDTTSSGSKTSTSTSGSSSPLHLCKKYLHLDGHHPPRYYNITKIWTGPLEGPQRFKTPNIIYIYDKQSDRIQRIHPQRSNHENRCFRYIRPQKSPKIAQKTAT